MTCPSDIKEKRAAVEGFCQHYGLTGSRLSDDGRTILLTPEDDERLRASGAIADIADWVAGEYYNFGVRVVQ